MEVRKLYSLDPHIIFIKLDLANFLLFLTLLPMTLLLLILINSRVLVALKLVSNIEVSRVLILLNL